MYVLPGHTHLHFIGKCQRYIFSTFLRITCYNRDYIRSRCNIYICNLSLRSNDHRRLELDVTLRVERLFLAVPRGCLRIVIV